MQVFVLDPFQLSVIYIYMHVTHNNQYGRRMSRLVAIQLTSHRKLLNWVKVRSVRRLNLNNAPLAVIKSVSSCMYGAELGLSP